MKLQVFSHSGGVESVPSDIFDPLMIVLAGVSFRPADKPTDIRQTIVDTLQNLGWTDRIHVTSGSKISITGMYKSIGLCVQMGNVARFYADLLKLQLLFNRGRITATIYIALTKDAAAVHKANLVQTDRLLAELNEYRSIITVPIAIIGVEGE
jgi:hypothetical protein